MSLKKVFIAFGAMVGVLATTASPASGVGDPVAYSSWKELPREVKVAQRVIVPTNTQGLTLTKDGIQVTDCGKGFLVIAKYQKGSKTVEVQQVGRRSDCDLAPFSFAGDDSRVKTPIGTAAIDADCGFDAKANMPKAGFEGTCTKADVKSSGGFITMFIADGAGSKNPELLVITEGLGHRQVVKIARGLRFAS